MDRNAHSLTVAPGGPASRLHLTLLRLASLSGHIRRAALALARAFPASTRARIAFPEGGELEVPLADAYWARLAVGWEHEPEVRAFIELALRFAPSASLIDCGANIGYWGARFAPLTEVIAVEPVPSTYQRLRRCADENGFTAVQAAVWSSDGEVEVGWTPLRHPGASIAVRPEHTQTAKVDAVTLATLLDTYCPGRAAVVKLDVEGAEVEAFNGAGEVLDRTLLIYEDHERDRSHSMTRAALARGLSVHCCVDGEIRPVHEVSSLDAIKVEAGRGYNFVAHLADGRWSGWLDEHL